MARRALPNYFLFRPRLLVVGLNPGTYSARIGHYYGRPANRFWPLLFRSGLVPVELKAEDDARLPEFGIAITDLCARATPGVDDLAAAELRRSGPRIGRLIRRLEPAVVAFNGLAGYRAAFDRRAQVGEQPTGLEGRPTFVMASTSPRVATWSFDEHLVEWRRLRRRVEQEAVSTTAGASRR